MDCSRNAVPTPASLRQLLRQLCRMGYNTVQLYMEDVYEVEGYPYFGHGRGRYTKGELKELDAFAARLGIELVPAVQTLAHLGQTLKWKAMAPFVDTGDILLTDSEDTGLCSMPCSTRWRSAFPAGGSTLAWTRPTCWAWAGTWTCTATRTAPL